MTSVLLWHGDAVGELDKYLVRTLTGLNGEGGRIGMGVLLWFDMKR